jgi:hypothetical protein
MAPAGAPRTRTCWRRPSTSSRNSSTASCTAGRAPDRATADASSGLGGALRGPFDRGRGGPGGWRILDEPELHLGEDIVVPDLAGWKRNRLPHLPDEAYFVVAPDWICEVLSPTTAAFDRVKKLAVYAREAGGMSGWWIRWRGLSKRCASNRAGGPLSLLMAAAM